MANFLSRLFGGGRDATPPRDVNVLTAALQAPSLHITKQDVPSRSYLGGSPRLAPGTDWPTRRGSKLGFLGRLSLTEVQAADPVPWLPGEGALLFFYDLDEQPWGFDPKDHDCCAVLLVPDLDEPVEPEGGDASDDPPIARRNVGFRRIATMPTTERDEVKALRLTKRELDAYTDLLETPYDEQPKHQVGGFPSPVQGDGMELDCQLASNGLYCGNSSGYEDPRAAELEPGAADWRLLLQLDTDDDLKVMWGDCGTLYFWVKQHEARVGELSGAWLILQCG